MLPIFSDDARSVLQGFLERNVLYNLIFIYSQPKRRLGAGKDGINNIKDHPFFCDIDWDKLEAKKIKPMYIPQLEGNHDLSNIDKMFTKEAPRETPDEEDRILKKAKFEDFTYVEKNNFLDTSYDNIN